MQNMIQPALEQFHDMIVMDADKYIPSLLAGADHSLVAQST
jgi:hypothetical protein